jgi:thiol-disulfide isomerase/thioredoxin
MKKLTIIFLSFRFLIIFSQIPKTLDIGSDAPDFQLTGIDNKIYTLSDFNASKVLVILFTDNVCSTSQAYEDRFIKLCKEYSAEKVSFVAINSNYQPAIAMEEMSYTDLGNTFEEMKIRAKEKSFPFPYLFDADIQKAAVLYGPTNVPHVFVFDDKRKLRYQGRIDNIENPYLQPTDKECKNAIDAILSGMPIKKPVTKPFGCPIKWKSDTISKIKIDDQWNKKTVRLLNISKSGIEKVLNNFSPGLLILYLRPFSLNNDSILINLINIHRMYNNRGVELINFCYGNDKNKNQITNLLSNNHAAVKNYFINDENLKIINNMLDYPWKNEKHEIILIETGGNVIERFSEDIDFYLLKKLIIKHIGRYYADN